MQNDKSAAETTPTDIAGNPIAKSEFHTVSSEDGKLKFAVSRPLPCPTKTTVKTGWHQGREFWLDGALVGWIGGCFDPKTQENTGYYGQATDPVRFLVKDVSRDEAIAAVEEAARAK